MHNSLHTDKSAASEPEASPLKLGRAAVIASALTIAVVVFGVTMRANTAGEVRRWTDERATPSVSLYQPRYDASSNVLVLPGNLQAFFEAPIFARVSGYLKRWDVDIGARVKAGQLLAEIDTPELYQQLEQAKADLVSAKSNEKLAEITAQRWKNLRATDSVSQQEADQKAGDLAAKTAAVAAAQANVNRYQTLESFKRITAPFDGIVTARKTDIGALINAGSGTGVELFSVADVHKLRVFARVPQIYASRIKIDMSAVLMVPEHPGKTFPAVLKRTSGAISATSGTLLAELEVDNKEGLLTPGSYAEIKLDLAGNSKAQRVPASALILRRGGVQLATVDKENRVVMKKVIVGLDLGSEVEILSGLDAADKVIETPPDSLEQGDLVRVLEPAAPKPVAQSPSPKKEKE